MINVSVKCKEIYEELLNIANSINDINPYDNRSLTTDLALSLYNVLINILKADNNFSSKEIELMNYVFSTNLDRNDIESMISGNKIKNIESFLSSAFFQSCINCDILKINTLYSRQVVFYLNELCIGISSIDGDISNSEISQWTSFISLLEGELDKMSIPKSKQPPKSYFNDLVGSTTLTNEQNSLDVYLESLNSLIGLENVKKDVNTMINLIKVRKLRQENNLPIIPLSLHMVFLGNPGTGKTTVARILSKIYNALGVLSKGHLIEVDRSSLVAGYVGQTSIKVQEVIEKSLGGILFIDEAYSLVSGRGETDFGYEAIDILLKSMEDKRDDFIVIVAGYPDKMEDFLNSNPGLRSRFNKYIDFKDYTTQELYMIFEKLCTKNGFVISEDLKSKITTYFDSYIKDETFANGRTVRNVFEKIVQSQANRVIAIPDIKKEDLQSLTGEDFITE